MTNVIQGYFNIDDKCECASCGVSSDEYPTLGLKIKDLFYPICANCSMKHTAAIVDFLSHISLEAQKKGFV